ncbi:MAG: sugar phosphate isomerase/epimerase family protein [Chitinophagales bacterium]
MDGRIKNSVGIWAFGGNATRFMPSGYHPGAVKETMVEKTRRAVDGLGDLVDGFEYHYPGEVNEANLDQVLAALGGKDLYAVALGLFGEPRYALGTFTNPDAGLRREVVQVTKAGIDLAAGAGANFIIWPGGDGYNYPFQVDYAALWQHFLEGVGEVVDYAARKGVRVFLEHKNSEPAMKILMRNMGMSLYVVHKLKELGYDTSLLQLNMDWQHLIMNGENLAEYVAVLAGEGLLGHQHANSGWGTFDDDNMVGALNFTETVAIAKELQRVGYGTRGERIGFDLFPYTEDQVEAVRRSILHWEFIMELAGRIDDARLAEAQGRSDAVSAYAAVFAALGLDEAWEADLLARRRSARR